MSQNASDLHSAIAAIPAHLLHRLAGQVLAIRDDRSLLRTRMIAYAIEGHKLKLSPAERPGVTTIHQLTPACLQQCLLEIAADKDTPERYRFALQEIADQPQRNARKIQFSVAAASAVMVMWTAATFASGWQILS